MGKGKPAWEPCPLCEDMWCNVHKCHAWENECTCPGMEDWGEWNPYEPGSCGRMKRIEAKLKQSGSAESAET